MSAPGRLWALRDDRPGFVLLVVFTLLVLATYPVIDWWLRAADIATQYTYHDFGAFSGDVNRWQAGEELYLQADDGGYRGTYLYPPIVLPLYLPFTWLDFTAAGWRGI